MITNAYCLVRPPGHHAERDRGMGFCLFNNVALGALHAQAKHGVKRMAIVDYDVHHGNGTQASTSSDRARPSLPPPYCISFAFFFCLIRHQRQIKRFSLSSPPSLPPSLTASLLQGPLRALHLHPSRHNNSPLHSLPSLPISLHPSLPHSKPSTKTPPCSSSPFIRIATIPLGRAMSRNGGRKRGRAIRSTFPFLRGVGVRRTFRRLSAWCCRRCG